MSSQESEQQITLYVPEFDNQDKEIILNNLTHEILQTSTLKEQQKLIRIYDDKFLNLNENNARGIATYNIRLSLLNARPVNKYIIAFRFLFISIVFVSIAAIVQKLADMRIEHFTNPYIYAVSALSIAFAAIFLVYMVKKSRHVLIFTSKHGKVPIVEMLYRNPEKKVFNAFVSELMNCIQAVDRQNYFTPAQVLAAELSEHRRLRNEGLISNQCYEKAKARILESHTVAG